MEKRFDVVEVTISTNTVMLMTNGRGSSDAVAVQRMAIARRGNNGNFFAIVPAGVYADGDTWKGPHEEMPTEPYDEKRGSIVRIGSTWYPDGPRGL